MPGLLEILLSRMYPSTSEKDIKKILQCNHGMQVPYRKAWRTYQAAMKIGVRELDDSYDQLRWYYDAIKRTNKGILLILCKVF